MKAVSIAVAFALVGSVWADEPAPEAGTPEVTADEAQSEPEVDDSASGPSAIDAVLPAGIRIIAARDTTLPVAAVVLAIETGTEDDPSERPGLVHGLAYHLLQGNRELPPEGAARIAHDGGGVTSMAVGPAQIRYESLVPVSLLDDMLWAESQRLRSPSVDESLWRDSLAWARRDARRHRALPLETLAALHGAEGLAHAGRNASPEVKAMLPRAVAQELADRMSYSRATLVVVSPLDPGEVLERARALFADLPPRGRQNHDRFSPPRGADGPRRFTQPEADGSVIAWPVPPGTEELERARLLCRVINRQRRSDDESAGGRLRCHLDEDPRRAALVLRATGAEDPVALVRARLRRITEGEDDRLLEQQRQHVARSLVLELSTPLALARRLATTDPRSSSDDEPSTERPLAHLTGLGASSASAGQREAIAERYTLEAALQVVPSGP